MRVCVCVCMCVEKSSVHTVDVGGDRGGVGGSQSGESLPVHSQWDGRKAGLH